MSRVGAADGVRPAALADLSAVLADAPRFWADRDVRHLHHPMLVHEFGDTAFVHEAPDGTIDGYLFGLVTPARLGYAHVVAVRDDARGGGLGRLLYRRFATAAQAGGATGLKAVTTLTNTASIALHRSLGFAAATVPDYSGPGGHRVVFRRQLPW